MKTRTIISNIGALLLIVFGTAAAAGEAEVRRVLEQYQTKFDLPGITASIALRDGTIISSAVGMADVEHQTAMTVETRMLAASIGKTLVGALVLSLESDGYLAREDQVAEYLSKHEWYKRLPNHDSVTVEHLLRHQGGLPDHVRLKDIGPKLIQLGMSKTFDPVDAIQFILDEAPLFEAGTAWSYSDTGYLVLGLVIEAATGRGFYELVEQRLLQPLGLNDTIPSNARTLHRLAVGYTSEENAFDLPVRTMDSEGQLAWNPAIEWAGGGFVSTSRDLAHWGHVLFSGQAMKVPYLDRLLDGVAVHPDAPDVAYGSGVGIYAKTELGPVYGHGGWIPGYVSSLRHYADHGITIAFQVNTDVGVADDSANFVPELEADLINAVIAQDK